MKNILKLTITIIIMILCFATMSYGFGVGDLTGTQSNLGTLTNVGNSIVKVISTIGVITSVIVLIILGIKFMIGSAEEKAEYKKTLLPYVIGAGLVFAASAIAQVISNLAKSL